MIIHTRRDILKTGIVLGASTMFPRNVYPNSIDSPNHYSAIHDESNLKSIVNSAVDSAVSAGAQYADARLTHTQDLSYSGMATPRRGEFMGIGVRALYQGYWGFAAGAIWSLEDAASLGTEALENAKVNVLGNPREVDLAPAVLESGTWFTPVEADPFEIAFEEVFDFMSGLRTFISGLKFFNSSRIGVAFTRQKKAFGNSSGQFTLQQLYRTTGIVEFGIKDQKNRTAAASLDTLTPAGMGFEHLRGQQLRSQIEVAHEEAMRDLELEIKPIEPGRYTTLIDQLGVASAVNETIGVATQIDRAMGYEANAGGTSYIVDPQEMLGTFKIGNSSLNISCDRSEPGSVGRVKWDDEGVNPRKFDLVKDGILINMQTNREGAGWIKSHYQSSNQEFSSGGCAYAQDAIDSPLVQSADLTLRSGSEPNDLDSMRKEIDKGMELKAPTFDMDFQQITGLAIGSIYEVKGGKRTARLVKGGILFRTPELWSNLIQLGGSSSSKRFGMMTKKGEPEQSSYHSIYSPPAAFKEMTFIDISRKA